MSEDVTIRLPGAADAVALLALLERLQQESDTFSLADADDPISAAQEAEQLEQIKLSSKHLLLVACLGRQLLGVLSISPTPQGNVGELGIAVEKTYWHLGIGTALVDEALYWADTASSLQAVGLIVQTRNVAAVKLYEKMGFVRTQTPPEMVTDDDGEQVKAVEMVYRLD
ncbi:GNAT family N-acetyltransferase [Levilactobacillus tujiorum]|uniref:GNAT family N-acetyltransferase n=1 Tax=Levilactobacillus tujiorum TaxID=2912243 RepID=A0ABX1L2Z5_9LACO|nr:GNAT family N-acetyltransferase [Levilactobacillus tujiorum]MCH5464498.1 GNAT family N-acetyltransferase [Levilactobacillus tujiorum]NLR11518.1 GNAT family N-acetyltransferase [Lactobacillus sp. HBUAS51387]NLR29400.1 GNAT family N-acetyltransferase [Levilactobacillus tujiorum]